MEDPKQKAPQDLGSLCCLASRPVCCADELLDPGFTGKELCIRSASPVSQISICSFLDNWAFLFCTESIETSYNLKKKKKKEWEMNQGRKKPIKGCHSVNKLLLKPEAKSILLKNHLECAPELSFGTEMRSYLLTNSLRTYPRFLNPSTSIKFELIRGPETVHFRWAQRKQKSWDKRHSGNVLQVMDRCSRSSTGRYIF